jgi:ferric-dicitrate binding protein FerR (iron transport regulator)
VDRQLTTAEAVMADEDFLAWYFKTDAAKASAWTEWLQQHPSAQPVVDEAILHLEDIYVVEKDIPYDQQQHAYRNLMDQINAGKVVSMHRKPFRWWIPAAAAIMILVAGYAYWNTQTPSLKMNSAYGKINEYNLPDGSMVTLNANSEIRMNDNWKEGKDREVWISGEAFFKVQKTASQNRFIVHADEMDIIVTGTQFNVVNREGMSSVLLTEGSITLKTEDGRELHLKPGDFVKVENTKATKAQVNEEQVLAWKQSMLVFDKTTLADVARTINRHYGVKVSFEAEELQNRTVSGMMSNNNLDVLIRALEEVGDCRITKNGNDLVIAYP